MDTGGSPTWRRWLRLPVRVELPWLAGDAEVTLTVGSSWHVVDVQMTDGR